MQKDQSVLRCFPAFTAKLFTKHRSIDMRLCRALFSAVAWRLIVLSLLSATGSSRLWAQVDPNIENGLHPFGSYVGSDIDTVSLTSGNLSLRIPLFSIPQRGNLKATVMIGLGRTSYYISPTCYTPQDTCTANWNPVGDYAGPSLFVDDGRADSFFNGGLRSVPLEILSAVNLALAVVLFRHPIADQHRLV